MKSLRAAAFLVAAWGTIVLSIYAAFIAFNTFYLTPDDPHITLTLNWIERIGITAFAVVVLFALWALSYMCFAKRSELLKRYSFGDCSETDTSASPNPRQQPHPAQSVSSAAAHLDTRLRP